MNNYLLSIGLVSTLICRFASADAKLSGFFEYEGRYFWNDPIYDTSTLNYVSSGAFEPALTWTDGSKTNKLSLKLFGRKDEYDEQRTHADIREAYYTYQESRWDILIGLNKVFWGVTESSHIVDIINQIDAVEDIDGEDKLGQLMINANLHLDWGKLELYVLPHFRERKFSGLNGRFQPLLPINYENARYESSSEDKHVDVAIRYSHYYDNVDIGIHAFRGTNRDPQFILANDLTSLDPFYETMSQIGVDLQYTQDSWMWKLEAYGRSSKQDNYFASVTGFEYTFYQPLRSDLDVGIMLEHGYDGRKSTLPAANLDNDIFLGTRIAFNDEHDSSLVLGITHDVDNQNQYSNLEYKTRLTDGITVNGRIGTIIKINDNSPNIDLTNDDYIEMSLKVWI